MAARLTIIAMTRRITGLLRRGSTPLIGTIAALYLGATTAMAQNAIGTAVGVTPAATGELGGTRVTLVNGNDLYQGQIIATDAGGEVQIVFVDDTRMVVGPNSILQIETYLLRNANTLENFTANALGGTFRFISGNSSPEAYTIRTPTGTIGVRGTAFDFTVLQLAMGVWQVDVLAYAGIVILCALNGVCTELDATCEVGTITPTLAEAVAQARRARQLARNDFPYARFQLGLLAVLQVEDPRGCLWAFTGGGGGNADIDEEEESSGSSGSGPSGSESSGESSSVPCFPSSYGNKGGKGPPPWWEPADCSFGDKSLSARLLKKYAFLAGLA